MSPSQPGLEFVLAEAGGNSHMNATDRASVEARNLKWASQRLILPTLSRVPAVHGSNQLSFS